MRPIHKVPGMPGWRDLGSDVSWDDHGGKWGKLAADGSVFVIDFTNMYDACGEGECKRDGQAQYVCEVKRVNLPELDVEQIATALKSCGMRRVGATQIVSDAADVVADFSEDPTTYRYVLAEACVSYGLAEPLDSFSGDARPANVRANARRAAEALMLDAKALETRRARPVNKIGSTAAEYGRGDVDSALDRGPFDTAKNLMRKLHGLPPIDESSDGSPV